MTRLNLSVLLLCVSLALPVPGARAQDMSGGLDSTANQRVMTAQPASGAATDLAPISLAPPGSGAALLPMDEGLRQVDDIVHRMEHALAGIVHEARRTEVDVEANPLVAGFGLGWPYLMGYDPMMLDPLEGYGFDFSLDTAPVVTHDTGELLPPRKAVLDPLVAEVGNSMSELAADLASIQVPASLPEETRVQWEVLNDTLRQMQQHVQWLKDVTTNNTDDNALIAQAAIHVHDDAGGIDDIARRLLKALPH
ncbi:MAG TPA: hypothetical protein V6D08_02120 [Candidatus Obscuribacterales bacterium]